MFYSRRDFLRHTGLLTTGTLLSSFPKYNPISLGTSLVGTRPNIIFIMCDDLGYGELGCYGQTTIQTPNLDKFASEGTKFFRAYAPSSVCAPTRWSLMTGKHIGHAHTSINENTYLHAVAILEDEAVLATEGIIRLSQQDTTLAQLIKQAGYETACIGKWGLGGTYNDATPVDKGFDYFFGYMTHTEAQQYYLDHIWENKTVVWIDANQNEAQGVYIPDLLLDKTLEFISGEHTTPFFLYLPYIIPHANILLEDTGNGMEVPSDEPYSTQPWPQVEKNYAAMITRLDQYVGQILQSLKDTGVEQNTIVFFTSDNGPHSQGGHDYKFFNSAGTLRGHKEELYEGGIRVPLLLRWPSVIPPNTVNHAIWCHYDLLPTILELAGAAIPAEIDGRSLVPILSGQQPENRNYLYWAYGKPDNWYTEAVQEDDWKIIRTSPNTPVELYNLAIDPSETTNLAAQYPGVLQNLSKVLNDFCPPPEPCPLFLPLISKW